MWWRRQHRGVGVEAKRQDKRKRVVHLTMATSFPIPRGCCLVSTAAIVRASSSHPCLLSPPFPGVAS